MSASLHFAKIRPNEGVNASGICGAFADRSGHCRRRGHRGAGIFFELPKARATPVVLLKRHKVVQVHVSQWALNRSHFRLSNWPMEFVIALIIGFAAGYGSGAGFGS